MHYPNHLASANLERRAGVDSGSGGQVQARDRSE